jgi:hypothetical protein
MTATEQVVGGKTPPLAVQASRSSPKKIRKRGSNGRKWCTKNQMVLAKSIYEVVATSMVSSCCLSGQGVGVGGGPGHVSMAKCKVRKNVFSTSAACFLWKNGLFFFALVLCAVRI